MTTALSPTIEDVYASMADAIDHAGPSHEALLLAKLCLLLAHALDNPTKALALITEAALDLE
jgi:hypothetical protein